MTSTLRRLPGSWAEEDLLDHLDRHVDSEQELLDDYAALAAESPGHVRYLLGLIVDDEARHHRIVREMANRVLGEMESCRVEPSVPYVSFEGSDRERLFAATRRFLELEREDLRSLEAMARVVRQQRPGGLFPLLVRLMELDTQKHIAILEFIAKDAHRPRK